MELDTLNTPSDVWDSANFVVEHAHDVTIDDAGLKALAEPVRQRFLKGFDNVEDAFGSTDDLDKDINLVYFETAANFCFWAQDDKDKWKFEHNSQSSGGWYGLRNAFAKALDDGVPIYDPQFMSELTLSQAANIFRGQDNIQIPLLEWRVNNIVDAANFLLRKHEGSAHLFLKACDFDAPTIAREITHALTSYRDGAWYEGKWIWILKRAQILPNDLSQLTQKYPDFAIKNTHKLTVFADYRLPQILEHYGVLQYSQSLSQKIIGKQLLPSGSTEEVEIRAATIAACKNLSELLPDMTIADIDVSLWLISQDMRSDPSLKPHHLTVSYFY
ncbi:MAG: hypothetical protein H6797_01215 [Candidatus Nomurabacteria bacterium]|nr:MAG: hypothetical protein H6797_01215 [Candidatus Nomurabacteria bacterium]